LPDPVAVVDLDEAYRAPASSAGAAFLRANFVVSLDGSVAVDGRSEGLSSPADRQVFRTLRGLCDVVLVGAGTVRTERYGPVRLPAARREWRVARGLAPTPRLAVVSSALELDFDYPLFKGDGPPPILLTTAAAPRSRRIEAAPRAEVVVAGDRRVDLGLALHELLDRNLDHVLCEGGPGLLASLLDAGLVDELCLSIAPLLAGPGGKRLLTGSPLPSPVGLELAQVLTDGSTLFIRYRHRDGAG
ncbi:MAG: pyrimidine reductase family protein, partial [Acidimicrobiales bacterium]|nr:pyrimidine reductase family protein [Acidimicrobiales bacterium]